MAQETQAPLHVLSQQTPSVQWPEAQVLALVQAWPLLLMHLPFPSQACPFAQLPATSVPALARTQVPSDPATLHDLHGPVQVPESQHTPSAQLPDAQEAAKAAVQPSPLPHLLTRYSQVSLVEAPVLLAMPPKRTTTPRPLSKTMAAL
jgi:hypothetical protein